MVEQRNSPIVLKSLLEKGKNLSTNKETTGKKIADPNSTKNVHTNKKSSKPSLLYL
jgi:hypothetical protein